MTVKIGVEVTHQVLHFPTVSMLLQTIFIKLVGECVYPGRKYVQCDSVFDAVFCTFALQMPFGNMLAADCTSVTHLNYVHWLPCLREAPLKGMVNHCGKHPVSKSSGGNTGKTTPEICYIF